MRKRRKQVWMDAEKKLPWAGIIINIKRKEKMEKN